MKIKVGKHEIPLPQSKAIRIALGIFCLLLGCLGFLPILGFWMIPLGLMILSIDWPFARHIRDKISKWWKNKKHNKAA
ncbi:MAG: PGPGW domain-containing protein [Rickettsiales bacterium]